MLRITKLGRFPADAAIRLHQINRVQRMPAVVALVSSSPLVAAVRARSLHVSVRQKAVATRAVRQQHRVRVDVALFFQPQEKVLHHRLVVLGMRGGEQVKGDAQPFPRIKELCVVAFQHFLRFHTLLVGTDRYGRAVGVGAGYHKHVAALHAVIAGENIGGQIAAGNVSHVQRAVGIGPRDTYQDAFGHGKPP